MSTCGALPPEHQIDLERLVDEGRIVDVLLDLLLERQDEPRPHQPLQRLLIEIVRGVLQARALAEAEGLLERRRIVALGVAGRQIAAESRSARRPAIDRDR